MRRWGNSMLIFGRPLEISMWSLFFIKLITASQKKDGQINKTFNEG